MSMWSELKSHAAKHALVSWDMCPRFSFNQRSYNGFNNTEFFSQFTHGLAVHASPSYFNNLFIGKFYSSRPFSSRRSLWFGITTACHTLRVSTLAMPIEIVFGFCSKKQVIGITTRWVVALVAYAHAIWYWSVFQKPRKSMSYVIAPRELSVSIFRPTPYPFPAFAISTAPNAFPKHINLLRSWIDFYRGTRRSIYRFIHNNSMFEFSIRCLLEEGVECGSFQR